MRTRRVRGVPKAATTPTIEEIKTWPATVDLVTAARPYGIGRTKAHEMARAGTFPVRVLMIGNRYRVSTAEILAHLGVGDAGSSATASEPAA
jgi:hypothetical protein